MLFQKQDIFTSKINQNKIKLIPVVPSLIKTKTGTEIKIINNILCYLKKCKLKNTIK